MNLANKLTLARVIMVPFFLVLMLVQAIPLNYLWAAVIFALASLTDMADGKIARKYNMITDFGKFLDPLADKVLVVAALICFVELGWTYAWLVAVIVAREFMVSGVRLAAAGSEKKVVIAASIWGKLKTASTMVSIVIILLLHILLQLGVAIEPFAVTLTSDILMYLCTALTVISGITYLWDYREVINTNK